MTVLLSILCLILIGGGLIFSVLPPFPGPLLSFAALLIAHFFVEDVFYSSGTLWTWGIIVTIVLIVDFTLPFLATKKFGGTKAGIYGGMIGVVAGILLPIPFGIILGPLMGAIIGDLVGGNQIREAFKSGFGSFVGFVVGTMAKVIISTIIGVVIMVDLGGIGLGYLREFMAT